MKKNLACFLAAVMTITAMPVNALAWGNGNGQQATVRLANNPPLVVSGNNRQVEIGALRDGVRMTEDDLFEHDEWVPANDLLVIFPENEVVASPMQFVLELENATWRNNNDSVDLSRGRWDGRTYTRFVDPLMFFTEVRREGEPGTLNFVNPATGLATGSWDEILQILTGLNANGTLIEDATRYILFDGVSYAANATPAQVAARADAIAAFRNAINNAVSGAPLNENNVQYLYNALRNLDLGALGVSLNVPLYTLEVSAGNASRATVTIADGFDFSDFVNNDRQEAIPRSAEVVKPSVDLPSVLAPSTPDTGDVEVPAEPAPAEVVETFGKKKTEEQAPEGETAPEATPEETDEVKPARTTEAVLVDAMDEVDYQAITTGDIAAPAINHDKLIAEAKASADAAVKLYENLVNQAELGINPANLEQSHAILTRAAQIISIVNTAMARVGQRPSLAQIQQYIWDSVANGNNSVGLTAQEAVTGLPNGFDLYGAKFDDAQDPNNIVASLALRLSSVEGLPLFSISEEGNATGTRAERIQFSLNQLRLQFIALQQVMQDVPNQTAPFASGPAYNAVVEIARAISANFSAIQRLIRTSVFTQGTEAVRLSAATGIRIPLVVNGTGGNVDRTVQVVDSTFPISTSVLTFSRSGLGGRTTATVNGVATGRDRIALNAITIMENRPRVLPTTFRSDREHNVLELVAPSGFRWARPGDNVSVTTEGGIISVSGAQVRYTPNTDQTVLTLSYTELDRGNTAGITNGQSRLAGGLTISGLVLLSDNPDVTLNRELEVTVRDVSGQNFIDEQSLLVARTRDFGISITGSNNTIVNGRIGNDNMGGNIDNRQARITISEELANSIASGRELVITLPSQVHVRALRISGDRLQGFNLGTTYFNDHGQYIASQLRPGNDENVRITDNVIRIRNLETTSNTQGSNVHLNLWLNIEAGFEGDIEATVSGSFLASDVDTNTVVIGQAINPVSIEAEVRRVRIGQQFTPVADFSITENQAGAIRTGDMNVSIVDEFLTELHIGPSFQAAVTEGNLGVRSFTTTNNTGGFGTGINWRQGSTIVVEVNHTSTVPSTIEFSNVMVRLAPTSPAPTANQVYSILVWGESVVDNFEGLRPNDAPRWGLNDYFRTPGISKVFLQAATSALSNVAQLTVGSPIILVNGQQMGMDVEPFINAESESLMIPVRFVAMALGLEPGRVLWDTPRATVTVDAGQGSVVQFVIGKDTMLVNGIEFPMLNALGRPVKAEIKDGRAFIPFRALADALDVFVSWDAATATATFDATRPAERGFHLEDLITAGPATVIEAVPLPAEVPAA